MKSQWRLAKPYPQATSSSPWSPLANQVQKAWIVTCVQKYYCLISPSAHPAGDELKHIMKAHKTGHCFKDPLSSDTDKINFKTPSYVKSELADYRLYWSIGLRMEIIIAQRWCNHVDLPHRHLFSKRCPSISHTRSSMVKKSVQTNSVKDLQITHSDCG